MRTDEPFWFAGRKTNGMGRLQKLITLIRQREFRRIWNVGTAYVPQRIYTFFAVRRDKRFGGVSVNTLIPSKHGEQGAYATQSSDYRCLNRVFRAVPLRPDDVFVDVGCGEGRVLTYLYEKGFRGRMIGVELDADAAATAMRPTPPTTRRGRTRCWSRASCFGTRPLCICSIRFAAPSCMTLCACSQPSVPAPCASIT